MKNKAIIFEFLDKNKSTYEYSIVCLEENEFNKGRSFFIHVEVFIHGGYNRVLTFMMLYLDDRLVIRRAEISNVFKHESEWFTNSKSMFLLDFLNLCYKKFINNVGETGGDN